MLKLWAGLAAGVMVAGFAPGLAAAPLATYGQLPNIEQIAISPDGKLLAIDFVKGEDRAIVVQDLAARKILTGVKVGQTKVRGLEWAGDNHLLIVSSAFVRTFEDHGALPEDPSEASFAADFNLATHKVSPLLGDVELTEDKIVGTPAVRMLDGKPVAFATGYFMARQADASNVVVHASQLALFKIDLDTDRSTMIASNQPEVTGFVVGNDGRPLAEETYDATSTRWALNLYSDGVWHEAQSGKAALERPMINGLGRDPRSVLITNVENGRPVLRELTSGGALSDPLPGPQHRRTAAGPRQPHAHRRGDARRRLPSYHFYDPSDQAQWDAVVKAFPGRASRSPRRRRATAKSWCTWTRPPTVPAMCWST